MTWISSFVIDNWIDKCRRFFSWSYIMYLEYYILLNTSQLTLNCLYLELSWTVHSHVWTSIFCTDFETDTENQAIYIYSTQFLLHFQFFFYFPSFVYIWNFVTKTFYYQSFPTITGHRTKKCFQQNLKSKGLLYTVLVLIIIKNELKFTFSTDLITSHCLGISPSMLHLATTSESDKAVEIKPSASGDA